MGKEVHDTGSGESGCKMAIRNRLREESLGGKRS